MNDNKQLSTKKKIFFVLSSLVSGGSERVFWNIAQGINKERFEVAIIILNSKANCFSSELDQVRLIDLNTLKASKSLFALHRLLKEEKPNVVFSATDHINLLVSFVARFLKSTKFIARISNIPSEQILYDDFKTKLYAQFAKRSYGVFDRVICQTEYMEQAVRRDYSVPASKTLVIPNPVLANDLVKVGENKTKHYKLLLVARFAPEKGLDRLIDIFSSLPSNYQLSMVGKGRLKDVIKQKVDSSNLNDRVKFYGEVTNVHELMTQHDLLVLSSHTEGCPNVVIEALSVGLPVVAFKVSGTKELLREGFNGYEIVQNDLVSFKEKIMQACTSTEWNYTEIKADLYRKLDFKKICEAYEQLTN